MSDTKDLEQKLQDRREARAKREEAQYNVDLEARIDLEDEHGQLTAVRVSRFVDGQPTLALVRTPTASEYKRFKDLVHRAVGMKNETTKKSEAIDQIARSCWVYPAPKAADGEPSDAQNEMLETFPGLLTPIANVAIALAEGKSEDEGKG